MAAYGQEGGRRDTTDLHTLFIVLSSLKQLCSEPQLVVDLFVNYDCDLAAPALFERTMHALGWLAQKQDVSDLSDPLSASRGGGQMSVKQQQEALARLAAVREAAQRCIVAVVVALESWTQALREGQGAKGAVLPSTAQDSPKQSEAAEHGSQAERLEAVWALKTHLSRAISLFNSSPVKGVRYLVKQGMVDNQPQFAERYVIDNSGQFRNADGAYLLSFAIIMLNTDAHNPLAERRLGQADFVAMCQQPLSEEEGGGSEPVLPPPELEAIYQRIVSQELQLHDADMGLVTPWKPLAKNWGKGLAQPGVTDKDRKRALAQLAERAISQSPGGTWTTAQHAELARPMLTVAAQAIVDALAAGLATAGSVAAAEPLLRCLVSVVQLAGALRLEEVGDKAVGVLAAAAGVAQPAAYASPQEQKQLAALKALLALGVSEAGHLGSGWTLVLRTLSALDILTAQLTAPAVVGPSGRGIILAGTASPGPSSADSSLVANNPFNKMFQALGINLGIGNGSPMGPAAGAGSAQGQAADAGAVNGERGPAGLPAVRLGPGASLVLWAEAEGKPLLQQRVVEAAHANLGQAMC
ncbi:SEC7 domain-containing protein [Haematococcus lacustris]|uniref:SEC7 domain-containing protein n=1 Tax=Haematococcus lacustris TaxID=44745 RepID=A0A6A0A5X0_HAELA|nr:SEC7 domain-containing protein [Haematococcus lacustris]